MEIKVTLNEKDIQMLERYRQSQIEIIIRVANERRIEEKSFWLADAERYKAMGYGDLIESFLYHHDTTRERLR